MTDALSLRLATLDASQLRALVLRLCEVRPELGPFAVLPLPGEPGALDLVRLRAAVDSILGAMGWGWGNAARAEHDLSFYVDAADTLAATRRAGDARDAYVTVLQAILARYQAIHDDEGEVASVVGRCVAGLGALFREAVEPLRGVILRDLFEVFAWDCLDQGGYGIGDPVEALLAAHADAEERERLLAWIRDRTPAPGSREASWRRARGGEFALALLPPDGDPVVAEETMRWAGLSERLVRELLQAGRTGAAVEALAGARTEVLRCVTALEAAGLGTEVRAIVARHPALLGPEGDGLSRWLASRGHDTAAIDALRWSLGPVLGRPTIGGWNDVRRKADAAGLWSATREALLAAVENERSSTQTVRARALAAVGRVGEALAVLQRLPDSSWPTAALSVARDAAETEPEVARTLYDAILDRLVGRKGRLAKEERALMTAERSRLPPRATGTPGTKG